MTSSRGESSSHWNGITVGEQAQAHIGHSYTTNIQITENCAKAVFRACTLSRETFGSFIEEIRAFRVLLEDTKDAAESQQLDSKHAIGFGNVLEGCNKCLVDLEAFVVHYNGLPMSTQRSWDRIPYNTEKMGDLKGRLGRSLASLSSISSTITTSLLVQQRLDKFIDEIRTGRREGSVISTYSIGASSLHEAADWKVICKELQDVGITARMVADHKSYIIKTLQELVESGGLEEQAPEVDIGQLSYSTQSTPVMVGSLSRENQSHASPIQRMLRRNRVARALTNVFGRPNKLLLQAAETGNLNEVKRLLDKKIGADIESKNSLGNPPLALATRGGHYDTVDYLLKQGANVDGGRYGTYNSLFMEAWSYGYRKISILLLQHGANIEAMNHEMKTILMVATEEGRSKIVNFLLGLGAKVDAKDKHGQTSLMYVCRKYRPRPSHTERSFMKARDEDTDHEIATLLLKAGADVETTNCVQVTPLILASKNGLLKIASLLLEKGANIEAEDPLQNTSLAIASQGGFLKIVTLLLEKGADIEAVGFGIFGKREHNTLQMLSPLQMASRHGHHTIVKFLLSKGAWVDRGKAQGDTALLWAVVQNNFEVVKVLLQHGAEVNITDTNGCTALMLATDRNNFEVVKVLLQYGANVNTTGANGYTAIMLATDRKNLDVVKILLEFGAIVDARSANWDKALMLATEKNNVEVLKILLERGEHKEKALMLATDQNNVEVLKILLEQKVDLNSMTLGGHTALMLAAVQNHTEVLWVILGQYGVYLETKNIGGATALALAAMYLHTASAELLIMAGADRKAVDLSDVGRLASRNERDKTQKMLEILRE